MKVRLVKCSFGMARSGFIAQHTYIAHDSEGQPLKAAPKDGKFWLRCPVQKDGWYPADSEEVQIVK